MHNLDLALTLALTTAGCAPTQQQTPLHLTNNLFDIAQSIALGLSKPAHFWSLA